MKLSSSNIFIVWGIITLVHPDVETASRVFWSASGQQFLCHCANQMCSDEGDCQPGFSCDRGWFGPKCQYEDLAIMSTLNTSDYFQLTDANDSTCVPNMTSLKMVWDVPYEFTWIQLTLEPDEGGEAQFYVTNGHNSMNITRTYPSRKELYYFIIDLYFNTNSTSENLSIMWTGVRSVCSLHISGGRNVALKESASQSSTYQHNFPFPVSLEAANAVDGNTNNSVESSSCSHTHNGTGQFWQVAFTHTLAVNRYVIYNRNLLAERLKGFTLEIGEDESNPAFTYTDTEAQPRQIYTITTLTQRVRYVKIRPFHEATYLTLCEVQVFGDTICKAGWYGMGCSQPCSCARGKCHTATGACLEGCDPGFTGVTCTQELQDSTGSSKDNAATIGLSVGISSAVVIIVIVIIAIIYLKRKRKQSRKSDPGQQVYDHFDAGAHEHHEYNRVESDRKQNVSGDQGDMSVYDQICVRGSSKHVYSTPIRVENDYVHPEFMYANTTNESQEKRNSTVYTNHNPLNNGIKSVSET